MPPLTLYDVAAGTVRGGKVGPWWRPDALLYDLEKNERSQTSNP